MTILKILHFPDNKLRQKGENIEVFDRKLKEITQDMLQTMYDANGIGLAAVQVNLPMRLIVIDVSENRDEPLILINPIIESKEEKIIFEEGCLSVPGFYEKVERFNIIHYSFFDINGKKCSDTADGLLSVCIQHEIDHLDGKLFVDYISSVKRDRIAKKIKKLESQGATQSRKNIPYSI